MEDFNTNRPSAGWRKTLFEVIFESDTPAGKWFDILLILSILNCMTSLRDTIKWTQPNGYDCLIG